MATQENRSLIDGLRCLQELVMSDGPVGSRDMARRVGLEPTRANRLLRTLAAQGLCEQDAGRKYRPGPGVHVLAAQSLTGSRLLSAALPHLEALDRPGASTALGVLWRGHVCYLVHRRPGMRLDEAVGTLPSGPAGRSSIGVLLHGLQAGRGDFDEIAGGADETEETVEGASLDDAGRAAARTGHARLRFDTGDLSLAVPVGAPVVAGLALAGRWDEVDEAALLSDLREAARRITADMAR